MSIKQLFIAAAILIVFWTLSAAVYAEEQSMYVLRTVDKTVNFVSGPHPNRDLAVCNAQIAKGLPKIRLKHGLNADAWCAILPEQPLMGQLMEKPIPKPVLEKRIIT